MPLNSIPPTTTLEGLRAKQEAAAGELMVDVGFWGGAVPGNLGDLEPLWEAGVFGFKCFLSPSGVDEFPPLDPEQFLAALTEIARFDGLMIVHAEDAAVLESAPSPPSPAYADFLVSRPDAAELDAIAQVLDGARQTGARVHILHLSSARALDLIADARAEGLPVTVETCPHYLCFAAETIPDAAPQFKCCPPIRDAGNREELWQALRAGVIDTIVSDHSPATAEEKNRGDGDLQQAWGGVSGLQVGFSAVAQEARRRGIGLDRVSRWMSRNTAALVGLADKGRIAAGADADFAVYDTGVDFRIEAARLAHRNPISAYDGLRYGGRVTRSVVRGNAIDVERPDHGWGRQLVRTEEVPA
jgi:allantoinase